MTVSTALRLFTFAVLLMFLPVNDAQSNSPACGQSTFSGLTGNITSPNYPYYYDYNQFCNYIIDAPSLSTITFTFDALGLEQHYYCSYDWIEFTCESNSISRPVRYCGYDYRPQLSFKPCTRVSMRFSSDGYGTGSGFVVSYDIEPISCQGNCTPVANGAGYNCNCDANQTPFIAPPDDQCPDGCVDSSTYCACPLPPTTPSTTLPPTTPASHPACGQSTFSDLTGSIASPNYPYYYDYNQFCNYIIDAPSLSTINFTFDALGLEESSSCYYDWIEFTCESNSISRPVRYCGYGYRAQLSVKPCTRVSMRFFSDGYATGPGFLVSYDIEPISCQGNCTPVTSGAGYICSCDENQTPYIAPPYNQCPDSGCLDSTTYCACSLPHTNMNTSPPTTAFEWYNSENVTETPSSPPSTFVSCYECWYSANSMDTANKSACSPQNNSRNGKVCNGAACQTYSYSSTSYAYASVTQECVAASFYEESLRYCQNQSQVYDTKYFFEGDHCCLSYKDYHSVVKACYCATDYCNNYILNPTVVSQSDDVTTSSPN